MTTKRTTYGTAEHEGVTFFIKHVAKSKLFGTKTLWREHAKLSISDVPRTLLDVIDTPHLGAGLQHVMDCMGEFKAQGDDQQLWQLIQYAERVGNGALFKKLGFLAEALSFDPAFIEACSKRLTTGYAHLDADAVNERLVTRWRLWVPEGLKH
jgi:predicted transcriptional regulator of viral defense system